MGSDEGNTGGFPAPQCTGPFADWCPVHPRPAEAPAAPVAERMHEDGVLCICDKCMVETVAKMGTGMTFGELAKVVGERNDAKRQLAILEDLHVKSVVDWNARIAALEAELAEAKKQDKALTAVLEGFKEATERCIAVAVQAERERATAHADILVMDIETQDKHADPCPLVRSSRDRIKNGDPAP